MANRYTKADLEKIVCQQLENLNAMHDLLKIMKVQNELIKSVIREEILEFKRKSYLKIK